MKPVSGKTVRVRYTAKLINGAILATPAGKIPEQFTMGRGEMLRGFERGLGMMKAGGRSLFVVPSNMGFVSMPYTPVIFEVELLSVR